MKKEMLERIEELKIFYESKREHQQKMVDQKLRIAERMEEKYKNGEVSYEKMNNAWRDKCFYDDFLRATETVLAELDYIVEGK